MKNLGIGIISLQGHCSSVCLFRDGKPIWALSEERLSRQKEDSKFPLLTLKECLRANGLKMEDIEQISFAWKPWTSFISTLKQNSLFLSWDFLLGKRKNGNNSRFMKFVSMLSVTSTIKRNFGYCPPFKYVDHHLCHASVALAHANYNNALCLVVDGYGEHSTASLFHYEHGSFRSLIHVPFPHSLGIFYSTLTQYLGFQADLDEYKVMGLAAYGRPIYENQICKLIQFDDKNLIKLNLEYFSHYKSSNQFFSKQLCLLLGEPEELSFQNRADIAASVQHVFCEIVKKILAKIKKDFGELSDSICLSGGVFQNCALNHEIRIQQLFPKIFITPLCLDLGTAMGAGYLHLISTGKHFSSFSSLLLGSEFSEQQIEEDLRSENLYYEKVENREKVAAEMLKEGFIIGWFQGRSEFGPRALGARSILADPRPLDMKSRVNEKIKKREAFRPFAPSVLKEKANHFFEIPEGVDLQYMIETVSTKAEIAKQIPSVIHVDGTARIQTVSKEDNFLYYNLIQEYEKLTGIGLILNTSFNIKDEPIVNTPRDAIRCFQTASLDALVIGPFVIRKSRND